MISTIDLTFLMFTIILFLNHFLSSITPMSSPFLVLIILMSPIAPSTTANHLTLNSSRTDQKVVLLFNVFFLSIKTFLIPETSLEILDTSHHLLYNTAEAVCQTSALKLV